MYLIQKRKSAASQWHTVKNLHGKKQCSEDLDVLSLCMDGLKGSYPWCDFRIIDNTTGDVVSVKRGVLNGNID